MRLGRKPGQRVESVEAGPYGSGPTPSWLHHDWSQHLRSAEIEGRRVSYLDVGDGDPLLFVHGWSSGWQHWLEQIPHFSRTHRVIAPDLPGFGASEMPAGEISITNYARTLDALCDHLDVERVTVVGSSMGGFVGAELALAFATRVEGLVLVAAAGLAKRYIGLPTVVLRNPALDTVEQVVLARLGAPDPVLRTLVSRPRGRKLALGAVCAQPQRLHPAMAYEIARLAGHEGAAPAVGALARYDFRDRLAEVCCPTLVVWGDTDRLVPLSSAGDFEQRIPGARKLVYRRTGHLPMVERPERFNADLDAYLTENRRDGGRGAIASAG